MKRYDVADIEAESALSACIASILEKDIRPISGFQDSFAHAWITQVKAVFLQNGFDMAVVHPDSGYLPKPVSIAVGKSPEGQRHAILIRNGETFHDPHPNRNGLDHIEICFVPIRLTQADQDFDMTEPPDRV